MSDWKDIVKTVAPVLGTALGGPMAGTAIKFLAGALLGKPDAPEAEVAQAVTNATPDQLIEIKKLDQEFKLKMEQLGVDVFKLEVQDKASARELAKFNMIPHLIMTTVYTVGYFFVMYLLLTGQFQPVENSRELLAGLVGVLTAIQIKIADFWFGSSYGSKVKDPR